MFFIVAYLIFLPQILLGKNLTQFDSAVSPRLVTKAVFVDGDKLHLLGRNDREMVTFSTKWFDEKSKKQDFPSDLEKFTIAEDKELVDIRAILLFENKLALLDGRSMKLRLLDRSSKRIIGDANIPWDTAKPAADRIGEPPPHETEKFRAILRKSFQKAPVKALAAAQLEPIGSTARFVVLTPFEIPLLEVHCKENDPFSCYVARGCKPRNFPSKTARNALTSVGKEIYVAHAGRNELSSYRFSSCLNVEKTSGIALPKNIKPVGALFGTKEFLFVATEDTLSELDGAALFRFHW